MPDEQAPLQIRRVAVPEEPFPERDVRSSMAGRVVEDPIHPDDESRERAAFGSETRRRVDPPAWFVELARTRATPDKVVEALIERLPEIKDSEVVRLMVNELGCLESAEEVLKRNLIPEVAAHLSH